MTVQTVCSVFRSQPSVGYGLVVGHQWESLGPKQHAPGCVEQTQHLCGNTTTRVYLVQR